MSDANIWTPGTGAPIISAEYRVLTQRFVATAGQTVFNLTNFTYEVNSGSIGVYVGGLKQQSGTDFTESASDRFTLDEPCFGGEVVLAEGYTAAAAEFASIDVSKLVAKDSSTGSAEIPAGTTAERTATPVIGATRFNTTTGLPECWNGTAWGPMGGGATGGTGNAAFYENDAEVTADYTITAGKNAMSAGPITIADGVTVTVPSGSVWSIV